MAREKEETRGWSVVLKMIDQQPGDDDDRPPLDPVLLDPDKSPGLQFPRDGERTVIDRNIASALNRQLAPKDDPSEPVDLAEAAALREESTFDTEGRKKKTPRDTQSDADAMAFADTTAPTKLPLESTQVDAKIVIPDDYTEPFDDAAGKSADDTFDDQATLRPNAFERYPSMPRPRITVADVSPKQTVEVKPPKITPHEPAKITPHDPKKSHGGSEVRVTPADPRHASSPKRAPAVDDTDDSFAPPIPAHLLRELGPPTHHRDAEMTVLDLAAQLGLAPEPTAPKGEEETEDRPSDKDAAAAKAEAAALSRPLDEQGAKVAELLQDEPVRPNILGKAMVGPKMRGETIFEHLPRWLPVTEGAAKIIPVLIATFVVFASVAVVLMLFQGAGGGGTEHVTLRFLPVQNADGKPIAANENLAAPIFTIETDPEGVLVVLDRKILGPTPITFELPMRADRVGVELTSPYFETWIGEAVREPTGEMRSKAKLKRKH